MSEKNPNAFPSKRNLDARNEWECHSGMSLRDYFAAKAMQSYLVSCGLQDVNAEKAYQMADEMIEARDK